MNKLYYTYYQNFKHKDNFVFEYFNNPDFDIDKVRSDQWIKVTRTITKDQALNYMSNPTKIFYLDTIKGALEHLAYPERLPCPIEEIPDNYTHFKIPKKSNPSKMRQIDAPKDTLKNYQAIIKGYLEDVLKILPHNAAHAYVKGRSTVTALKVHQNNESKWFLKLDLKNFFNSHNQEYVERMLNHIFPLGASFCIKEQLQKILPYAFLNDELPQGTPLSPTLTNICMIPIDEAIYRKLINYKKHRIVYTRYADDIIISCKEKFNPGEIIKEIHDIFKEWNVPFEINSEKTRFGSSSGRNWNLGIMLNKDNNLTIGHKQNQIFRATLHNFILNYNDWSTEEAYKLMGDIAYYQSIEREYINYTIDKYNKKYAVNIWQMLKNKVSQ